MIVSTTGERLVKRLEFTIFFPGNNMKQRTTYRAPARHGYTAANIDEIVDKVAEHVEKRFPVHEYRLVPVGPGRFNFVWECAKEPIPELKPVEAEAAHA